MRRLPQGLRRLPRGRAVLTHWANAYYGDLYLESAADLLGPRLSAAEALLIADLLGLGEGHRVLDLACGHGRHLAALGGRGLELFGLDRSMAYLRRGRPSLPGYALVQGDVRALPFRPASFDAIYSWYASLFMFPDPENERVLGLAASLLRPGGRLLVQHANPWKLAREPVARAGRELAGGGRCEELSRFDPSTGRETAVRRLLRDGKELAATCELRYYTADEWAWLAPRTGLRLLGLFSTAPGGRPGELGPEATDLIALMEKVT